jgi:pyruvate carboxylase
MQCRITTEDPEQNFIPDDDHQYLDRALSIKSPYPAA